MARILRTNVGHIDQLAAKGLLSRAPQNGYLYEEESIGRYVEHLRGIAARHKSEGYDVVREGALLKQAQRSVAELKAAKLRGDMISITEMYPLWAEAVKDFRAIVLSIPARVQAALPHLVATEMDAIRKCVREALTEFKVKGEEPPTTSAPDEVRAIAEPDHVT
jgi:phage terminase Nu1 subunit (DNA packaging protein)